jgi:signal transduction histidine kinase
MELRAVRPARGLRLRSKLLLLSLVLLALPWLGYRYAQEMRNFSLSGQERAQALTAQAIATVLHERPELFDTPTLPDDISRREALLYAFPLAQPIQLDGYADDWADLRSHARQFGPDSGLAFALILGMRGDQLFALLEVRDPRPVYRHPGYRRLDNGDHLRLRLVDGGGNERHVLVLAEGPGSTTAYEVGPDWRHAVDGRALRDLRGHWLPTGQGYRLELRLPLAWLGPQRRLHLAVADVQDERERTVQDLVGTLPGHEAGFNHLLLRSTELERILAGLERSSARIWILDRDRRVRAQVGSGSPGEGMEDHDMTTELRDEASVRRALQGHAALQRRPTLDGRGEMIMATHPVLVGETLLGAVVVEQSTTDILALQRHALERMGLLTLLTLLVIISTLMLFASRLALRMRRLSHEAHDAIGPDGRVRNMELHSDQRAGDEFGELSRTISSLLQRLARYTHFLERMPRMLRHELHNPLNVISTSLQNLSCQQDDASQRRYRDSAQRGVERIGAIVQALTDAASLEEALRQEDREPVDLRALLHHYTESCALQHPGRRFELEAGPLPAWVPVNDFRLEQLLDKLIANALDFSPPGSIIRLRLSHQDGMTCLAVANEGRPLPAGSREALFDSLVSRRESGSDDGHHLGMGLYVVRLIAEHAGGWVEADECETPPGVEIRVWLPEQEK